MRRFKTRLVLLLLLLPVAAGCARAIKRTTTVDVPQAYELARTASLEELVQLVNSRYSVVETLTVPSFEVRFEGGSTDVGYFERYPQARGYLVVHWPDSIFVSILNPLTSSTVVSMAARENAFQVWVPRENKYLFGDTRVELDDENPMHNVRPQHLIPAILMEEIPTGDDQYRVFLEEEQDEQFRYYVLGVVRIPPGHGPVELVRRLWIERSRMQVVRQQYYRDGTAVSRIRYGRPRVLNGSLVNTEVVLERPRERYTMQFTLDEEQVELNRPVDEEVFEVPRPPHAELVHVTDTQEKEPQLP